MKTQILLTVLLVFFTKAIHAQNVQWKTEMTSASDNFQSGMVMDDQGNSYITGRFFDDLKIAGESLIHEKPAGTYLGNIYLAKIDENGEHVWSTSGVPDDAGNFVHTENTNIGIDEHNNIYVAGTFEKTLTWEGKSVTNNHGYSYFMAKFNSSGDIQWLKKIGHSSAFQMYSFEDLAVTEQGDVYFAGRFRDSVAFDGQTIYTDDIQAFYLVKFNSDGSLDWTHIIERPSEETWPQLSLGTYQSDVLIAGYFNQDFSIDNKSFTPEGSENNLFAARLNDGGQLQWGKNLHSETDGTGVTFINSANNGNIFIGGTAMSDLPNEDIAMLITEIDQNGQHEWHQKYEVEGQRFLGIDPEFSGIQVNNEGKLYFAGNVNNGGTVNFGDLTFTMETPSRDGFAVKLDENRKVTSLIHFYGTTSGDEVKMINMELYQDSLINLSGNFEGTIKGDLELESEGDNENGFLAMLEHEVCPVASFVPEESSGCEGGTYTFENKSMNAKNYSWFINGEKVENAEKDLEYTFDNVADYEIKLEVDYEGCTDEYSQEFTINLNPPVDLGDDTTITQGHSLELDAGGFGTEYTWLHNGDTTEETGQFFEVTEEGRYVVIAENIFGCKGSDEIQVNVVTSIAKDDPSTVNLLTYPNPASDKINVVLTDNLTGVYFRLYDMRGRKVLSKKPENFNTILDLSGIDEGVYQLKLYHQDISILSQQIIIQ